MYKEAVRQRIRFTTSVGSLSAEQLWDLTIPQLDSLAVGLDEQYKNSKGKSFVIKKTAKDKTTKLMFDIVLDILNTKVEERDEAANASEIKAHNEKIMEMISEKKDEMLKDKSIKELMKELK